MDLLLVEPVEIHQQVLLPFGGLLFLKQLQTFYRSGDISVNVRPKVLVR